MALDANDIARQYGVTAVREVWDAAKVSPADEAAAKAPPFKWLDLASWDGQQVPERQWAIFNRVPLRQAGLFSGEGGAGKSIVELTKNVAHVLGKDWLGSMPKPGPALYLGAEDDASELHIRLAAIAKHYGASFADLAKGGLHVMSLLGEDAVLCAHNPRSGRVETTGLYDRLLEAAGDIRPVNISVDTLSRAYAGSEIDRAAVYAFAMHMQKLAAVANGSVTVLSHPSLTGINTGTGISGSTAWHGAFRFRQFLAGAKANDGDPPDGDLRQLVFKKNQYGPLGEAVTLRWQDGLFVPEGSGSSLEKVARANLVDSVFLALLARFAQSGRNVAAQPNAPTYAPTAFVKEKEATADKVRKSELEDAMRRLFAADRIYVEDYGRPSRPNHRIATR